MNTRLHGLYAITDEILMHQAVFTQMAEAALAAGVSVLQYRDKSTDNIKRNQQAQALRKLCDKYNSLLIINDDITLAKKVNADGIHLGKNDTSLSMARQQLGHNKIIGISCYNQLSLAESAIQSGADYIAFGSFFSSSIKPEAAKADSHLIAAIKSRHDIPVCCIGGITAENCSPLLVAGADMLAVISEVFSQPSTEHITHNCKQLMNKFLPLTNKP